MSNCDQPDSLEHVMTCKYYPEDLRFDKTNYNYDPNEQEEFIEYLERLDKFRSSRFDLPVLYRPSLKKRIEKQMEAEKKGKG